MRTIAQFSLAVLMIISSCGQDDGINPSEESLDFYTNARLTGEYPYAFSGDNVVFHRHYTREDDKSIADDEYSDDFFLEVENPGDSFEFSGEALQEVKTIFLYYCYCPYTNYSTLKDGFVKGSKKSNNRYELEVDLTYEYYHIDENTKDTVDTYTREVKYKGIHQQDAVPSASQN